MGRMWNCETCVDTLALQLGDMIAGRVVHAIQRTFVNASEVVTTVRYVGDYEWHVVNDANN